MIFICASEPLESKKNKINEPKIQLLLAHHFLQKISESETSEIWARHRVKHKEYSSVHQNSYDPEVPLNAIVLENSQNPNSSLSNIRVPCFSNKVSIETTTSFSVKFD